MDREVDGLRSNIHWMTRQMMALLVIISMLAYVSFQTTPSAVYYCDGIYCDDDGCIVCACAFILCHLPPRHPPRVHGLGVGGLLAS